MSASNDKLEQHHLRQLSALMDGELAVDEARFLLRRLQHDDELTARWDRWHVVGGVLRGEALAPASGGFAARVGRAIAVDVPEAVPTSAQRPFSRGGVLRWGGALAASVAALALFVGMPREEEAVAPAAMAVAPSAEVEPSPEPVTATPALAAEPAPVEAIPARIAARPATAPVRRSPRQTTAATVAVAQPDAAAGLANHRESEASPYPAHVPALVAEAPFQQDVIEAAGLQNPPRPAARPWPRSVLQGGEGAYQAGYLTGGIDGNTPVVPSFTGQAALPLHVPVPLAEPSASVPGEEPQGPVRE